MTYFELAKTLKTEAELADFLVDNILCLLPINAMLLKNVVLEFLEMEVQQ